MIRFISSVRGTSHVLKQFYETIHQHSLRAFDFLLKYWLSFLKKTNIRNSHPGKTTSIPFLFMCESLLATGFCITFINWYNLLVYYCSHSLKYSYYLKITVVHVLLKRTKSHNVQTEQYQNVLSWR